jgi:ribosomal protein L6P/L9E
MVWGHVATLPQEPSPFKSLLLTSSRLPSAVEVTLNRRTVTVKGKRGELVRNFRHVQLEITKVDDTKLRIDAWFANRKVYFCRTPAALSGR